MNLKRGQIVTYNEIIAGCAQGYGELLRHPTKVVIVNPVCHKPPGPNEPQILVRKVGAKHPFDGSFNVEVSDLSIDNPNTTRKI